MQIGQAHSGAIRGGLLAAMILAGSSVGTAAAQQAPQVFVETVSEKPFVSRVEALGTLRANESVNVTALVTEKIAAIFFNDGQRVRAGDLLVQLSDVEERALADEVRATLQEARDQLDRAERLVSRGAITASERDLRQREYRVAQARLQVIEARIADRQIRAPFDGRMGIRTVSPGATVEPGDTIARLIDDRIMKLDFSVPSTFLSSLQPGVSIEAKTRAFPGLTFLGRIASVDSEIDPVTRSVLIRANIPNPDGRLVPGLLMQVDLLLNERMTLTVSEEAIIPVGTESFVLVVAERDGTPIVSRRKVRTGARRVGEVEILDGLNQGEVVVTEGALKVRPGQAVSPRTRESGFAPRAAGPTTAQRS